MNRDKAMIRKLKREIIRKDQEIKALKEKYHKLEVDSFLERNKYRKKMNKMVGDINYLLGFKDVLEALPHSSPLAIIDNTSKNIDEIDFSDYILFNVGKVTIIVREKYKPGEKPAVSSDTMWGVGEMYVDGLDTRAIMMKYKLTADDAIRLCHNFDRYIEKYPKDPDGLLYSYSNNPRFKIR